MASTRSIQRAQQLRPSADSPRDALARMQIAVGGAAARSCAGWAQAADRYADELSALPPTATDHFEARIPRVPTDD
jgi:hypothetical protein